MVKFRSIGLFLSLLIFTTSCTLPLIWDVPDEEPDPPVVVELSPTTTQPPKEVGLLDTPAPMASPLQPEISPTVEPPRSLETAVPTATFTPTPVLLPYILQQGSPVAVPNFSHPELGCNWLGVGGQVFDRRGQPQQSIIVEVRGALAGIEINKLVVSGGAAIFGEGGYELTLSERPIGTDGTLSIQLFDISGEPLSEPYSFSTYNDCGQNLILINFIEVPAQPYGIWLPMIER